MKQREDTIDRRKGRTRPEREGVELSDSNME
jgi:hypothetical protein